MRDIYEEAIKTLNPEDIDHHATDLYLRVTPESRALVNQYEFKTQVEIFFNNIAPHKLWYNIPFAYSPGWVRDEKTGWFPL